MLWADALMRSSPLQKISPIPDVQAAMRRYPTDTTKTGVNGAGPFIPVCLCVASAGVVKLHEFATVERDYTVMPGIGFASGTSAGLLYPRNT